VHKLKILLKAAVPIPEFCILSPFHGVAAAAPVHLRQSRIKVAISLDHKLLRRLKIRNCSNSNKNTRNI
jgi:hypothetical protein